MSDDIGTGRNYDPSYPYASPIDARDFSLLNAYDPNLAVWMVKSLSLFQRTEIQWQRYHGKPASILPPDIPEDKGLTWINDWIPPYCPTAQLSARWVSGTPYDPQAKNSYSPPTNPVNIDNGKCGIFYNTILEIPTYGGLEDPTTHTTTIIPPTPAYPTGNPVITPTPNTTPIPPLQLPVNTSQPPISPDSPVVAVASNPSVNPTNPLTAPNGNTGVVGPNNAANPLSALTSNPLVLVGVVVAAFVLLRK